nr:MAG TPA: Pyocin activator protein PrtN [Caudoviricetes sp.]
MAREKIDFEQNYSNILQHFGNVQLIPAKAAAEFLGIDVRTLRDDRCSPVKKVCGRYYVPVVSLARWLS